MTAAKGPRPAARKRGPATDGAAHGKEEGQGRERLLVPAGTRARVKEPEARAAFLSMGPDRSLSALHRRYAADMPNPPAIDTIKSWSRKFGWQALAAAHDAKVAAAVVAKVEAGQIKTMTQIAEAFMLAADRGLTAALTMSPESFGEAVSGAATATKMAALITGASATPTDRPPESPVARLNGSIRDRLKLIEASALAHVAPAGSAE